MDNFSATSGQCIAKWYCARTISGRERGLEAALNRLNIETYLPMFTRQRTRLVNRFIPATRQYCEVQEPIASKGALFPGYLFARLADQHWAAVKTRLGVSLRPRWVEFGSGPVSVDPDLLVAIAEWQDTPALSKQSHAFKQGDGVEILNGPFAGFTGLFSHNAEERIMVLVSMLGREPLIPFEPSEVQPLRFALV